MLEKISKFNVQTGVMSLTSAQDDSWRCMDLDGRVKYVRVWVILRLGQDEVCRWVVPPDRSEEFLDKDNVQRLATEFAVQELAGDLGLWRH